MKNSLIAFALLIFELSDSYGHSIRAPSKTVDNQQRYSDVYEVHNDGGSVTFVNPKLDEKKAREIIYYRVVEKPCSEDNAETERPFTNAHGYPFLKEFVHKDSNEPTPGSEAPTTTLPFETELSENLERRKRDVIEVIPEAPTVPAIRHESFPVYIRELLSNHPEETDSNNDDIKPMNSDEPILKPIIDERDAKNDNKLENIETTTLKSVNDRDNLNRYTEEINKKMAKAREAITAKLQKALDNLEHHRNIKLNTEEERDKTNVKDDTKDVAVSPNREIDSNYQEMPRTYGMRLLNGRGYVWNDIFTNPGLNYKIYSPENQYEIDIRDPIYELSNPIAQQSQNSATQIETNTDKEEDKLNDNNNSYNENINDDLDDIFLHIAKFKQTTPAPDEKEDLAIKRHKDKDTHKLIDELLESDEFWALVIEWSEMYMDILTKYIKKTVKAEVKKELEAHFSNIEIDYEKPDEANDNNAEEKEEHSQKTSEKHTDSEYLRKHELIIKKDGFIIDGIALPFINNYRVKDSVKGEFLKRRKVNKKKPTETANLDHKPATDKNDIMNANNHTGLINVEHVYGNNVGNEKVTNVFVFYPNEGLDKVLEELKPIAGDNGVLIIKPDKGEGMIDKETGKEVLTDGASPDKIDQKPEDGLENEDENGPEKEEIKETDENADTDSKEQTDDVQLDTRRFR